MKPRARVAPPRALVYAGGIGNRARVRACEIYAPPADHDVIVAVTVKITHDLSGHTEIVGLRRALQYGVAH